MDRMFGNTMQMTQKSMDYLWLKQTVAMNNIANNDTPGFKAQYVTFEDRLKKNLLKAKQISSGKKSIYSREIDDAGFTVHDTTDEARQDGNNVQMEAESTEMVRASLQYQYQLASLNSDIRRLNLAIKGQ